MTTYAENRSSTSTSRPLFAALGVGVSIVLTAMGTFWDLTGNDSGAAEDSFVDFLPVIGVILVAAAIVFGFVVRTEPDQAPGTRAIVLAVLSVLSVVVFWAGLPAVLAAGATACALAARRADGRLTPLAIASLCLSGAALALAVVAAIWG